MSISDINFPISNSLVIYGIILMIILLTPMLLKKIKIPSIVGLIIAGMLIGPNGLNIIVADPNISFFGNIGLLFIMFIAGLDLDFHEFKKFRNFNLFYGLLLFLLPSLLAFVIFRFFLGDSVIQSMLIAIIFSTNTLISYPIVKRLNVASTMPVIAAVGAAVLADTTILILLGFLKQFAVSGIDLTIVITVVLKFILYAGIILFVYPRLTRLYFKSIDIENTSQFLYTFTLLILTALLSHAFDIEPIVGAFLMGLALNHQIPHNSVLMGRIEFVGNALFIPFFLIYVGFMIDLKALFSDFAPWIYSLLFIFISFVGKYAAVYLASKSFKIDRDSRHLIFGLNLSQAGATIAIAIVIHSLGLVDTNFLNAVIILILSTCIVSTFISEKYGRRIAIKNANINIIPDTYPQRILVPYANPKTINTLLKTALLFKENNGEPLFPISVITEPEDANNIIYSNDKILSNILKQIEAFNITLTPTTRIDTSLPNALDRAINELMITTTVLGWNFKKSIDSNIYNKQLDQLLNRNSSMFLVCKINNIQSIKQINIFVPENAQFEKGYQRWIEILQVFAKNFSAAINIHQVNNESPYIYNIYKNSGLKPSIQYLPSFDSVEIEDLAKIDSINIVIHSRMKGISHSVKDNHFVNRLIDKAEDTNIIIIYPEQSKTFNIEEIYGYSEVMNESLISTNLNLLERLYNLIKKSIKG